MMVERKRALGAQGQWADTEQGLERSPYRDDNAERVDAEQVGSLGIRRFVLNRAEDHSGTSGTGIVAEGVRFTDGTVVLRWTVALKSTAVYNSVDDLIAIHGHDGSTTVVWADQ